MPTENDSTRAPLRALDHGLGLELLTYAFALAACCLLVLGLRDTPRLPAPRAPSAVPIASAEPRAKVCVDVVDAGGKAVVPARVRLYAERAGRRFEAVGELENRAGKCL